MSRKLVLLGVGLVTLALAAPAFAVTDRWAAWSPVDGASNAFRLTMTQQARGFPAATVATDSRSPVQVPTGATAFLGPGTPPGAKYGSSASNPYLVLRARADSPTAPSTTTYSFDAPTPDTGWAFVLGDIDADQVAITATDATGTPVPATEVDTWFRGTFNYTGGADQPTWNATTSTLTGNAGAVDTDGAAGWFEPDVRLSSLTMTFTRRAGFPVYQTWFVSRARPIGGTITDDSAIGNCPPATTSVSLLSPSGDVLATTTPAADGTYGFGELATQNGYVVRLDVPDGCVVRGPAEQTVSNRGNDNDAGSRADFDVRAIIPQPISGAVRDGTGAPVPGVTVTRTGPSGSATTTTDADGTYLFDDNPIGPGYTITITVPDGYVAGAGGVQISGIAVASSPITAQDFAIVDLPAVSGTVTGAGAGVGGIQVVLTPASGGAAFTAVTTGDGSYEVDGLPPGNYTLDVAAPAGWTPPPPRTITVTGAGLTGQDVALSRPGALGGAVTLDGAPAAGVSLTVDGPSGTQSLQTDAEGQYFLDTLPAGSYTITLTVPGGAVAAGPTTRTVIITAAGEVRGGQDFTLTPAPPGPPVPPVTPVPPVAPVPGVPPAQADPDVDLVLHKRAVTGTQVEVGGMVRYRLTVRNRGTDTASRPITLVDRLPAGLELVSANGDGWRCTTRKATDTARCVRKKRTGAGERAAPVVVVARATPAATGRVVNVARVRVAGESVRSNNQGTAAITVVPAQLPATGFRLQPGLLVARAGNACAPVDVPVVPSTLSIDGVLAATEVLSRGQDRAGVPKPPPLTARGRWQLAWDKASGVRPGGSAGVVRLTAHTYPRDRAQEPALGNLLLARLHPGARIQLVGTKGERLCYDVTRRQRLRSTASLSGFYDTTGAPRLAILVCSGERRGPGDWTHRTIWWAHPTQDGR